jgi:hypothetical protein
METLGRVQECGCIALAPEVQEQTGLYPDATFRVELTPDKRVLLVPMETKSAGDLKPHAKCG